MPTPSAYLSYLVIGCCLGAQAAIFFGLRFAAARQASSHPALGRLSWAVPIALVLWFALAVGLSWSGVFFGVANRFPTIQFGLLTPIVLAWWLLATKRGRSLTSAIPPAWVIGVQLYRVLGAVFLVLYSVHQLPGAFAWPAGVGDVITGVLAPIVALRYARRPEENQALAVRWNVFGLADLVVAVGTAFLTSPSPLQLLALDAPNRLISAFPLALVPLYLVPIAIVLHFVSLRQVKAAQLIRIHQ